MHGGGDFGRSITTAGRRGWDIDCNGATVGSIVGVMLEAQPLILFKLVSQHLVLCLQPPL